MGIPVSADDMFYRVNADARGRLNASPATVKAMQKNLGLPETGVWDEATDQAYSNWAQGEGYDPNFGMNNDAENWNTVQAALNQRGMGNAPGNPAMEDPAYQAFLRSMGVQQANIKNEIIARTEAVQRAINRNAAGYEVQKKDKQRSIGLGFEDRGLGNSGAQYRQQSEAAAAVDYDRQQSEASQHDALDAANRAATQSLAELGQRRAEEEIAARNRIGQRRAQQTYNPLG